MGNRVVHFEMAGPDGKALARFYADLFGWHTQEIPEAATPWSTPTAGAGSTAGWRVPDGEPYVTFYVERRDPQAVLDRAEALGGDDRLPVTETPLVTYGRFADPDGLQVGVVTGGRPVRRVAARPVGRRGAPVDWFEVLGSDAGATQKFYTELFGWTADSAGFPGLRPGAGRRRRRRWRAGLGRGIDVGDRVREGRRTSRTSLAKAESLGGERVYGPNDVDDHMQTGALRDPAGNVFGVYSHPDHH